MLRLMAAVLVAATFGPAGGSPAFSTVAEARAQTPQPFPRPGGGRPPTAPAAPPAAPTEAAAPRVTQPQPDPAEPSEATLGIPVYPGALFVASYDAGLGQRYYIFGATAPFDQVVGYYRARLDDRGDLVYREPPTHMFSGGSLERYRAETMAFPPSVTVKDWTSGGSQGYPNLRPDAEPARFPTIIMIVPAPAATPPR